MLSGEWKIAQPLRPEKLLKPFEIVSRVAIFFMLLIARPGSKPGLLNP